MLFFMKGNHEASFLNDVEVLILNHLLPTTGHQWGRHNGKTLRAGSDALYSSHESEVLFLMFKHYSLTVERKQSPREEESSQNKMEQSEKEWK